MRVIKPTRVKEYAKMFPDAEEQLMTWLKAARLADWRSIRDVRTMYPHADAVLVKSGNVVTIFNVRGNNYRLIVAIKYDYATVYILRFLTHTEYNKDKWKAEL
jgi:mRNA interferase HigB